MPGCYLEYSSTQIGGECCEKPLLMFARAWAKDSAPHIYQALLALDAGARAPVRAVCEGPWRVM